MCTCVFVTVTLCVYLCVCYSNTVCVLVCLCQVVSAVRPCVFVPGGVSSKTLCVVPGGVSSKTLGVCAMCQQ